MKDLIAQIQSFKAFNEQEEKDQTLLLEILKEGKDLFTRDNKCHHMTASAWVLNQSRDKVLMVHHNIYNSWSWLGGHADGEKDLLKLALKEVKEESGLEDLKVLSEDIFSLEVLTVDGHIKNGQYISSHLHLNVTYLLEANDQEKLVIKEDENSGVQWFSLEAAIEASSEPWFKENIYKKLNEKLKNIE